ncbi:MAG: hypothetical protein JWN14_1951 [Chthonomonadales bacterium]|nr:hypothetical protein [Chthonomonadales bacterium]
MTLLREFQEPDARTAHENLQVIRDLMERSTRYSTFSGLSGVLAGTASIVGCIVTHALTKPTGAVDPMGFLLTWSLVIVFAIGADYLWMKRRATRVGKRIVSPLGKQMLVASSPGLGAGLLLTLFFLQHGLIAHIYPVWMLCYGSAVAAVGLFSQREVSRLGAAFLLAGAATLFLPIAYGLPVMGIVFGGFHIVYGVVMSRKDGW